MAQTLLVVLVLFAGTLTSATFGFGGALFSMPLLTLVVGLDTALPLFGLIGPTTALLVAGLSWREAKLEQVWRLILATLMGIPVGVLLVRLLPQEPLIFGLGLFLIGFGSYRLLRVPLPQIKHPAWAFPFGFAAGILGGAYNTNGPPVVIYGNMNRWAPATFRATLQSYFLPTGLGIMISHGLGGLWSPQVFSLFGLAMPGVIAAVWIGGWLNRRLSMERFEQLVFVLLMGLGVLLVV